MKRSLFLSSLLGSFVFAQTFKGNPNDTTNAIYKNPKASLDARVADLLSRMTVQEKTSQIVQGDISNWLNMTDNTFNATGLAWNMAYRGGQFYVGYPSPQEWIAEGIKTGQEYLMHNTTFGIPALVQTEGIHGFLASRSKYPKTRKDAHCNQLMPPFSILL
jgi:beta-glucosidase